MPNTLNTPELSLAHASAVDALAAPSMAPVAGNVAGRRSARSVQAPRVAAFARRFMRVARRDPQMLLALALTVPVVVIHLVDGDRPVAQVLLAAAGFLLIQGLVTRSSYRGATSARLAVSLAYVVAANFHDMTSTLGPLAGLQIPVVAMAAAIGTRGGMAVAIIGLIATVGPALLPAAESAVRHQALAVAAAEIVLALGSRGVVASMERAIQRARDAQGRLRRRARQLSTVEAVSTLLAREGPRTEVLARVMDILVDTFDFHWPSVYLWDGAVLRLGAQRNYRNPIEEFDLSIGVIGRVARTRQPIFLADVSGDPDYREADPTITGEISIPLLNGEQLLGVINVESNRARRLDLEDFATMQIIGDRVAAALALGHERLKLATRAELLARLTDFSAGLNATLDPLTTHEFVAGGAARVIVASMVALILREPETGEYRTAAIVGGDPALIGIRVLPGEGASGRAILERQTVVDDELERGRFPRAARAARLPDVVASMAVPLMRDGEAFGAISWLRGDPATPYSEEEQDVAALLGVQAALALVNQGLLSEAREAAVTDPLTGLYNRRHFDAALETLIAQRRRVPEGERLPLSAVMFDLDHFGLINKREGHQVGDRVLRAFSAVLRARVRASDLLARYGGEEFVVILPGATREQAARLANEVREAFGAVETPIHDDEMLRCTVSAGCAALASTIVSGSTLLEHADVALAMAKSAGRNQVVTA